MKSFRDTEQPLLVSLQPLSLSTVRRLGAEQNALMGLAHRGRKGISPGQEVLAEGGPGGHLEAAPCIQAPGFPTFPLCNLVVGFVISSLPSWSRGGGRMDRAASHLRGGAILSGVSLVSAAQGFPPASPAITGPHAPRWSVTGRMSRISPWSHSGLPKQSGGPSPTLLKQNGFPAPLFPSISGKQWLLCVLGHR